VNCLELLVRIVVHRTMCVNFHAKPWPSPGQALCVCGRVGGQSVGPARPSEFSSMYENVRIVIRALCLYVMVEEQVHVNRVEGVILVVSA